jgi:hypothetical protein
MTFPFAGPASAGPASISAATPVSVGTTWQDLGNICSNNYVCTGTIPQCSGTGTVGTVTFTVAQPGP